MTAAEFAVIEGARNINNDPQKVGQMSRMAQGITVLAGIHGGPAMEKRLKMKGFIHGKKFLGLYGMELKRDFQSRSTFCQSISSPPAQNIYLHFLTIESQKRHSQVIFVRKAPNLGFYGVWLMEMGLQFSQTNLLVRPDLNRNYLKSFLGY